MFSLNVNFPEGSKDRVWFWVNKTEQQKAAEAECENSKEVIIGSIGMARYTSVTKPATRYSVLKDPQLAHLLKSFLRRLCEM